MIKLIMTDTCNFFYATTNDKFSLDKSYIQIYATLGDAGKTKRFCKNRCDSFFSFF